MKKDKENAGAGPASRIETISAVTLATHDMERAVRFYRSLGFTLRYGGEHASFTSFFAGSSYLNLIHQPETRRWSWWGRVIFYVSDVDALHEHAVAKALRPESAPRDAAWGGAILPRDRPGRPRDQLRHAPQAFWLYEEGRDRGLKGACRLFLL